MRLGGRHVDRVDVRPLLAVDLDRDEVGVELRGGRRVLERLVRHHVAPVAGRVADREQHRHVAPARPRRTPRPTTPTSRPGCRRAAAGTGWSQSASRFGIAPSCQPSGRAGRRGRPPSGRRRQRAAAARRGVAPDRATASSPAAVQSSGVLVGGSKRRRQPAGSAWSSTGSGAPWPAPSSSTTTSPTGRRLAELRALARRRGLRSSAGPPARSAPRRARPRSTSIGRTALHGPRRGSCSRTRRSARAALTARAVDAGEQVVLGQRGVDQRARQLVVLGRPDLALDARAAPQNQRLVGSIWVACALSASSRTWKQSAHWTRVVTRAPGSGRSAVPVRSSHSAYGDSSPRASSASWKAAMRALGEPVRVVELERLPRLARLRVAVRVAGRVERRHRDLVAPDVVGVRVAAVLVVGGHHVRAELADHRDQRAAAPRRRPARSSPRAAAAAGRPRAARSRRSRASGAARRGSRRPGPSRRGGSRPCSPARRGGPSPG